MNAIVLFYPRVQLFTKGWPTHTKNIAAKRWRRLQQLPPFSAQSNSTIIAQRRTSPVLCKLCDSLKRLLFFTSFRLSSSGKPRTRAQSSRRSHGTICIAPHYPRKSPFTRLYCQPKKRHCFEQQKSSLTWSKKRPSIKCTFHAVKERPLVTIAAWQGSAA